MDDRDYLPQRYVLYYKPSCEHGEMGKIASPCMYVSLTQLGWT